MMEENSKAKRKTLRQPLYDDKEFMEFLEMVRGLRAYSKVGHDKHLTTGLMLRLQRTLVNKPWFMGQAYLSHMLSVYKPMVNQP